MRLNKYLADHGIASRRACDELIAKGKVTIDGEPASELGTKVDPTQQVVEVDGVLLKPEGLERRYYLLNKPSGVVCTNEKRETRPRAMDLVTDPNKGRIYTIGRLDEDSLGLIILTNDGEFAERVAHPRYGVPKTYRVRVQGKIEDDVVQKVREGVHLSEGRTGGARILVRRRTVSGSQLEVTIREGKNREVRRVFARVGHKVTSLVRTRIGPLDDRGLKVGRWRALSRAEVESMLEMSTVEGAAKAMDDASEGTGAFESTRDRGGKAGPRRRSAARGGSAARRGTSADGARSRRGPATGRGGRRGASSGAKSGSSAGGSSGGRGTGVRGAARNAPRSTPRGSARGASRGSSRGGSRRSVRGASRGGRSSGYSPLDALEMVERGRRSSSAGPRRGSAGRSRRRRR